MFRTLILTTEQRIKLLFWARQILSTLYKHVCQAAVTLSLDIDDTLWTLSRMTSPNGAGVRTFLGPWFRTIQFTFLAVSSSLDIVLCSPDPVTVPGAGAVLTLKLPSTLPAA